MRSIGSADAPRIQPAVDALALVAFTIVGVRTHDEVPAAAVLARNAVPLIVCWFVAASVFHPYRDGSPAPWLRTWAASVPVALVVRTVIVGSPTGLRIAEFLAVGMVFTLLFLLAGRALVRIVERPTARRPRR